MTRVVSPILRSPPPLVYLTRAHLDLLSVRQWGLPTRRYVGKVWRSGGPFRWTLTALLPHENPDLVSIRSFEVIVVSSEDFERFPGEVLDAIDQYREIPGADLSVLRFGSEVRRSVS